MFRLETYYLYLVSLILKHEPYRKLIVPQARVSLFLGPLPLISLPVCSGMDKRLLVFFLIFGKWPLKVWGVIWPKDSLVLG